MAEADQFLKEMGQQQRHKGVQEVVRRNRLFVQRCHSVLEKVLETLHPKHYILTLHPKHYTLNPTS
jgi:hypothetical protein